MTELFSGLTGGSVWVIVLALAFLYVIVVGGLRLFLSPAIVGNLDPFSIEIIVFKGPAIIGLLLVPFITGVATDSFYIILAFLVVWILIVRIHGKPKSIDLRDHMGFDFQATLLFLAVLVIVLNVTVNMIIPGKIPLLTEGEGFASRFDATENSRVLTWLNFATAQTPGLIYALTQNVRIRRLAGFAVALQAVEGLLFASKSGILTIVIVLLGSAFVARSRREHERYKKLRRMLLASICVVVLLVPAYFSLIGFGGSTGTWFLLASRFLGGFDQLILAGQFDLVRHAGLDPIIKTDIIHYQLMPVFKALGSSQYPYNGIGEYIIESVTGIPVNGRGTYPNSNLILEMIFTSGKYLGALIFILELNIFYWYRRVALSRPVTPLNLVLVQCFVMTPTGLFSSGQDWIVQTILTLGTVLASFMLARLWAFTRVILMNAVSTMPEETIA